MTWAFQPLEAGAELLQSNINGSVAVALDALTLSATGQLAIKATLAQTLGALTSTAAGQLAIKGTTGGTLGPLQLSSTGVLLIQGQVGITLGALQLASTFELVSPPIAGTLDITLGSLMLSASGHGPLYTLGDYISSATVLEFEASLAVLGEDGTMSYQISKGDLTPGITIQVFENGVAKDVAAYSAFSMHWLKPDGTTADVTLAVLDAPTGKLFYQWQAGDTDLDGWHQALVVGTLAGKQQTFPSDGASAQWRVAPRPF